MRRRARRVVRRAGPGRAVDAQLRHAPHNELRRGLPLLTATADGAVAGRARYVPVAATPAVGGRPPHPSHHLPRRFAGGAGLLVLHLHGGQHALRLRARLGGRARQVLVLLLPAVAKRRRQLVLRRAQGGGGARHGGGAAGGGGARADRRAGSRRRRRRRRRLRAGLPAKPQPPQVRSGGAVENAGVFSCVWVLVLSKSYTRDTGPVLTSWAVRRRRSSPAAATARASSA